MCSTCDPQARKQKIFSIRIFKCSVSIIPAQKFACLKIKVKLVLKVSTPHLSRPKTCKGIQSQTIQETTTGLLYASVAGHRGCLASSARKKKKSRIHPYLMENASWSSQGWSGWDPRPSRSPFLMAWCQKTNQSKTKMKQKTAKDSIGQTLCSLWAQLTHLVAVLAWTSEQNFPKQKISKPSHVKCWAEKHTIHWI